MYNRKHSLRASQAIDFVSGHTCISVHVYLCVCALVVHIAAAPHCETYTHIHRSQMSVSQQQEVFVLILGRLELTKLTAGHGYKSLSFLFPQHYSLGL